VIAVIGRPVELVITVSFMDGVLCPIPAGVDECKRLAHEIAVHLDDNTIALVRGKWVFFAVSTEPVPNQRLAALWRAGGSGELWRALLDMQMEFT